MKGLVRSGALDASDKVSRAMFVSARQAVNNLNATAAVCNTNVTAFRREEVIQAFKSNLPDESLRRLREAPFDSRDLVSDELFAEVLRETREARHDDVLLEPIRQRHQYRRGQNSPSFRGGRGSGKKSKPSQRGGRGFGGDNRGGQSGHGGSSFRGQPRQQSGGKSSASNTRGGGKKGDSASKPGGGKSSPAPQ